MRLLLVVVMIAVTSAATESQSDETSELKDLLRAVKHYLLDTEETRNSKIAAPRQLDACTEEKIVYNSTAAKPRVDSGTTGQWTHWIDADFAQEDGLGEYEDCSRVIFEQDLKNACWLGCSSPLAAKYVVDKGFKTSCPTATWNEIVDCIGPNTLKLSSCGLTCLNNDVRKFHRDTSKCPVSSCDAKGLGPGCIYCPNIKVKFFCAGARPPPVDRCCPLPLGDNCGTGKVALHEALERIADVNARRDAAAEILEQIREAVKEGDN